MLQNGSLHPKSSRAAVEALLVRHEPLRARFAEDQSISENLFKILNESPSDNIGQHGFFGVHYFAS